MAFEKVEIFEFEPQSEEFEKAYFDLLDRPTCFEPNLTARKRAWLFTWEAMANRYVF